MSNFVLELSGQAMDKSGDEITIQEWCTRISGDEFRNGQITQDVLQCYRDGRNSVVLSLRTAHVERLQRE